MKNGSSSEETIGLDLSDKTGLYVVIDAAGEVAGEAKVKLSLDGVRKVFGVRQACRIAIEAGTHSPWLSRELARLGYEVIVANARQVGLITGNRKKKTDREDAETLARAARFDPRLLKPIQHRGEEAQADLAMLRSRKVLVQGRTRLVTSVRGMVKAAGGRLPRCSTDSFATRVKDHLPQLLKAALEPMLVTIAQLTHQIKAMERDLENLALRYRETEVLRQVDGVGLITSLTYVLTLEQPARFRRSRSVGAYLGMVERKSQSGEHDPQLRITKAGDEALRSALVQSAQRILGPFGKDSDLRRWGLRLAGPKGNKIRKHKAVIAVARKLSVLLHRLWLTGEVYEPLRQARLLATVA